MKKDGVKKVAGVHKLSNKPGGEKVKSEGSNASTDVPFDSTGFISNNKTTPGGGAA